MQMLKVIYHTQTRRETKNADSSLANRIRLDLLDKLRPEVRSYFFICSQTTQKLNEKKNKTTHTHTHKYEILTGSMRYLIFSSCVIDDGREISTQKAGRTSSASFICMPPT